MSVKYHEKFFFYYFTNGKFIYISDNRRIFTVTECFLNKTKSIVLVDMPIFTIDENIIGAPKKKIYFWYPTKKFLFSNIENIFGVSSLLLFLISLLKVIALPYFCYFSLSPLRA